MVIHFNLEGEGQKNDMLHVREKKEKRKEKEK